MFHAARAASQRPAARPMRGSGFGAVIETIGVTGGGITAGGRGGKGGRSPGRGAWAGAGAAMAGDVACSGAAACGSPSTFIDRINTEIKMTAETTFFIKETHPIIEGEKQPSFP